MRHRKRVRSPFEPRILADSRADYCDLYGPARTAKREQEIAALPRVTWKGHTLFTIRCTGDFGKGPHDYNVPESVLWNLMAFSRFRCAYHRP
jgi:hypothetical protein